jgi:hypothetical protein
MYDPTQRDQEQRDQAQRDEELRDRLRQAMATNTPMAITAGEASRIHEVWQDLLISRLPILPEWEAHQKTPISAPRKEVRRALW